MSAVTDRASWGPGPWDGELDAAIWTDQGTGLLCVARRDPVTGVWCGYVQLPEGHPWYPLTREGARLRVQVHGGLSFAGTPPGQRAGRWLGFDCLSGGDLAPCAACAHVAPALGTYRTIAYVQEQCTRLAAQIARAR